MKRQRTLAFLVSLPLAATVLVGCSQDSKSPTEPSASLAAAPAAGTASSVASSSLVSTTEESKGRGRGRGRGGRGGGNDDGNGNSGRGNGGGGNGGGGNGGGNPTPTPTPPRVGNEFEGSVVAVSGQTITLAGGTRIVVTGSTQWNARGDLMSLGAVAGSVASGNPTRVEGRGTRQADGAIVANTIKAEVDN
jgi:hypothetical protein